MSLLISNIIKLGSVCVKNHEIIISLYRNVSKFGSAYVQHGKAVRNAIAFSGEDAFTILSPYVKGLSETSFIGFKIYVKGLAVKESNEFVKQKLYWILAIVNDLRLAKLET